MVDIQRFGLRGPLDADCIAELLTEVHLNSGQFRQRSQLQLYPSHGFFGNPIGRKERFQEAD